MVVSRGLVLLTLLPILFCGNVTDPLRPFQFPAGGLLGSLRERFQKYDPLHRPKTHERHHERSFYDLSGPRSRGGLFSESMSRYVGSGYKSCRYSTSLSWRTRVGSTILQTPLITPFKNIIVTPHTNYIEHLQGESGSPVPPFPLTHPSLSTLASPLLYDITQNGNEEILVSSYDGLIFGVDMETGRVIRDRVLWIPGLKVEEGWWEGLDESSIDVVWEDLRPSPKPTTGVVVEESVEEETGETGGTGEGEAEAEVEPEKPTRLGEKVLLQIPEVADPEVDRVLLTKEARISLEKVMRTAGEFMSSRDTLNRIHDENPQHAFLSPKDREEMEKYYKDNEEEGHIFVDAHILSTPVIADIDNDGKDEIIIAVSYFFDENEYFGPDVLRLKELPVHVNLNKYVAGGIVVASLDTLEIKWWKHLDLTTRSHSQTALVYASPTVIDFDSNGSLDILITNSLGYVYALNYQGDVHEGYPIVELVEIQGGQIFAEDLTGDGFVEYCAVDVIRRSSQSHQPVVADLVCFNHDTERVWTRRLSGLIDHAPIVADVNGDGKLNMVLATRAGDIYVLQAATGQPLENFPMRVSEAAIRAPVTLVDFSTEINLDGTTKERQKTLDIVVPSVDGLLHIVNPVRQCHDMLDLGDESYSRVLVDDVTGNGLLDLIATTHNGYVQCLSTQVPYHPLKATNGFPGYDAHPFSYRDRRHGIFVPEPYRNARDIVGQNFVLPIEIVDERNLPKGYARSYRVRIWAGKMGYFYNEVLDTPGLHRLVLDVPAVRGSLVVHVTMVNENGQRFVDSFPLSFNVGFLRILKWAVVAPFLVAAALVVCLRDLKGDENDDLPS